MAFTKVKRADSRSLARCRNLIWPRLIIKDIEPAAGHERRDIAAAEAGVGIRFKQRIVGQSRFVAVGIYWLGREVFRGNGMIRRKWESENFVKADARARHRTVEALHKSGGESRVSRIKHGGLFDGTAHFPQANTLVKITHAATKFLLRPGAAGCEPSCKYSHSEKRHCVSHTFLNCWFEPTPKSPFVKRVLYFARGAFLFLPIPIPRDPNGDF